MALIGKGGAAIALRILLLCNGAEKTQCDFFGSDHNYIYAQVKKDGRWGSIDRNGKVISITIFPTMEIADYALSQLEHNRKVDGWRYPVTNGAGWTTPANG